MGNPGTRYELTTQQVFESIVHQQRECTIDVRHDVVLKGRSGATHQVDVYWEFESEGSTHGAVISCKDWKSPVKKDHILALKATLDDLPGSPEGAVVTRTGFQSGARTYAEYHGIHLYELRPPTDADWGERITSASITMTLFVPSFEDFQLAADRAWVQEEKRRLGVSRFEQISVRYRGGPDGLLLVDEQGEPSMSVDQVVLAMFPKVNEEFSARPGSFFFAEPTYVRTDHTSWPRVKLHSASARISMHTIEREIVVDIESLTSHILRDVSDGEIRHMFDADLNLLGT